jgi:hypothetical protein
MNRLLKAFLARLVHWVTPKPPRPIIMQEPEPPLRPGTCECDHERCCHIDGKGKCKAEFPPDKEWPRGAYCACEIFILDKDNGSDGTPQTPSPSELEELWKK